MIQLLIAIEIGRGIEKSFHNYKSAAITGIKEEKNPDFYIYM